MTHHPVPRWQHRGARRDRPSPLVFPGPLRSSVFVRPVRRLLAALALGGFIAAAAAQPAAAPRPPQVTDIEARLFLQQSGAFSAPLRDDTALWNTIIGEGDAGEPSSSTFVRVAVRGAPESFVPRVRVELVVLATGRKPSRTVLVKELAHFGAEGRQYIGFWLPDTGCEPLELTARVVGSAAVLRRKLPFSCGE